MKYLVVWKLPNGIAYVDNVYVIEAENAVDACIAAKKLEGTTSTDFHAWPIDELESGWGYYTKG